MTYSELLARLAAISPEDYVFEARVLAETFTRFKISYLIANKDTELEGAELERALEMREERVPLQYIVGKWDFYNQTYFVDESCLIPRQDTELLVELAIKLLPKDAHFADLCTGSGCVAVSVLCEREDTTACAVDKFDRTLDIAKKNAEYNGVSKRVSLRLFDVLEEECALGDERFDAILSNPPYIRREVIDTLSEEVKKEPMAALDGGEDGLVFYRKMISDYSKYLKKDGFMLFEIGYDQADEIKEICNKKGVFCEIFKDYSGNDRVAKIFGFKLA